MFKKIVLYCLDKNKEQKQKKITTKEIIIYLINLGLPDMLQDIGNKDKDYRDVIKIYFMLLSLIINITLYNPSLYLK